MADPANSVAVATGSPVVTGTLTAFLAAEFDLFMLDGLAVAIASRQSPTQLTLRQPWPGPTRSGAVGWEIANTGPYWQSTVSANRQLATLLNRFEAGPVKWDASGTRAGRDAYNNQPIDFVYLSVEPAPFTLFVKRANTNSAADWSSGQPLQMPAENTEAAQAAKAAAQVAAATSQQQAAVATAGAGTATTQAGIASGAADTATNKATLATQQADAAAAARQEAVAARDIVVPILPQAQAAAAATAGDRVQTGIDRAAVGGSVSASQLARDAAVAAAADARAAAAALGIAAFDWSYDSNPDASNDWSNG
jgi:hypothetical protein